jgi:hypothetical protein
MDQKTRKELVKLVMKDGFTVRKASEKLGLKFSTVRSLWNLWEMRENSLSTKLLLIPKNRRNKKRRPVRNINPVVIKQLKIQRLSPIKDLNRMETKGFEQLRSYHQFKLMRMSLILFKIKPCEIVSSLRPSCFHFKAAFLKCSMYCLNISSFPCFQRFYPQCQQRSQTTTRLDSESNII